MLLSNPSPSFRIGKLADIELLNIARSYRRRTAAAWRLLKPEDVKRLPQGKLTTSIKEDGKLFFLLKLGEVCILFDQAGVMLADLPLLQTAAEVLADLDDLLLAGELILPDPITGRSHARTVAAAYAGERDQVERLQFCAFDILRLHGATFVREDLAHLFATLRELLPAQGLCHAVHTRELTPLGVQSYYQETVTLGGAEGLVCLCDQTGARYKLKPEHHIDAVIVGFAAHPDQPDSVGMILTALLRPDGSFQTLARVAHGMDSLQRRELFAMLHPLSVDGDYTETTHGHTLITMVMPVHVVEIGFDDIAAHLPDGSRKQRAVLHYADDFWSVRPPEEIVGLIAPRFIRMREDKAVTPAELRLSQLYPYTDLTNLEAPARQWVDAKSEILRREVFAKGAGPSRAIRKFISWRTNKHRDDPNYPAYVFCFVDYSPNRTHPLKRIARIAASPARIDAFFESFKTERIKRGWRKVG